MRLKSLLPLIAVALPLAAESPVDVKIPFPFEMNGKAMPSGVYTVQINDEQNVVRLQSIEQRKASFAIASRSTPIEGGKQVRLTFAHTGDRYILSGVAGPSAAGDIVLSKAVRSALAPAPTIAAR
jgi:hypothetical protein